MLEFDRHLREVAQLRKLWRAFREPQERLEDARLSAPVVRDHARLASVREPVALYGRPAIRAAIRWWWCGEEYAAIVEMGQRIDPALLEEEPLTQVYVEEAKARIPRG